MQLGRAHELVERLRVEAQLHAGLARQAPDRSHVLGEGGASLLEGGDQRVAGPRAPGARALARRVQALVGQPQRGVGPVGVGWHQRHAVQRGDPKGAAMLGQRRVGSGDDGVGPPLADGRQHSEAVGLEPVGASPRPHRLGQPPVQPFQHRRAGQRAEAVVVGLEADELEHG